VDYNAPEKVHLRELAAGRPAVLIGQTGKPKFERPVWGNYSVNDPGEPTEEYYFESGSAALLELLPDPALKHYRLSAEIRHIHHLGAASQVGIYFGHRIYQSPAGEDHWFYRIEVADVGSTRGTYTPEQVAPGGDPTCQRMFLRLCRRRAGQQLVDTGDDQELCHQDYPVPELSSDRAYGPWHKIVVTVDLDAVQIWWDEKPIRRVLRQKINFLAANFLNYKPNAVATFLTDPLGQGGVGLFVYHGVALYRNVIIEPLQ
jgi:hypothetical protein